MSDVNQPCPTICSGCGSRCGLDREARPADCAQTRLDDIAQAVSLQWPATTNAMTRGQVDSLIRNLQPFV